MLTLNRQCSSARGTFGVFIYDRSILCLALERPWLGNLPGKSCIPTGSYKVIKVHHPKYGNCFRVENVPGRSGILIHSGNTIEDTSGCILPGHSSDRFGVSESRVALRDMLKILPSDFQLNIREV